MANCKNKNKPKRKSWLKLNQFVVHQQQLTNTNDFLGTDLAINGGHGELHVAMRDVRLTVVKTTTAKELLSSGGKRSITTDNQVCMNLILWSIRPLKQTNSRKVWFKIFNYNQVAQPSWCITNKALPWHSDGLSLLTAHRNWTEWPHSKQEVPASSKSPKSHRLQ